jgi:hypothetical protein
VLSAELNSNSTHSFTQVPDGLTAQNPLDSALSGQPSNNPSGKTLANGIDESVSRWVKGGRKASVTPAYNLIEGDRQGNRIRGTSGNDKIYGRAGSDRVFGEGGNDLLMGDSGNDTLVGGTGNDVMQGDSGRDALTTGSGNDIVVLSLSKKNGKIEKADVVTDFSNGQDSIKLEGGLSFERLSIVQGKGKYAKDTLLRDRQTGEYVAVLKGVSKALIDKADFAQTANAPLPSPSPSPTPGGPPSPSPTPTVGTISLGAVNFNVGEGGGSATITVKRTGSSSGESRINFATINGGTATVGSDYTAASGTLIFANGQTSKTFTIPITNDTAVEGNETIKVALTNPTGANLGTQNTATVTIADNDTATPPPVGGGSSGGGAAAASIVGGAVKFSPGDSEAAIAAKGGARIKIGTQTIYIGTQQVTSINQNPIIASFDSANPANNWVKTNYEATGADGRGYGLFWDGSNLYGVFSVDGTQGTPSQDFRRVSGGATQAWLRSYGQGGGPKIAVLGKLDPRTGELVGAAYLSSRLDSGKSNSLAVTDLSVNNSGNLVVKANSWYAPRRVDGSQMTPNGSASSPFSYTLEITRDLKTVVRTSAVGWS